MYGIGITMNEIITQLKIVINASSITCVIFSTYVIISCSDFATVTMNEWVISLYTILISQE